MRAEIAIQDKESALEIVKILVEEEYCVLLSKEESLYIINYEYSEHSDRNNVIFMDRETFEDKYIEVEEYNEN